MRAGATSSPNADARLRQRNSFSTLRLKSTPISEPIWGFRMWVVGVNPCGSCQTPSENSRAVLRCAPASEIRKRGPTPRGRRSSSETSRATSASEIGVPRTAPGRPGSSPSGTKVSAPAEQRPRYASRVYGWVSGASTRAASRARMPPESGNRLSRNRNTRSPRWPAGSSGRESETGVAPSHASQSESYWRASPDGVRVSVPRRLPFSKRWRVRPGNLMPHARCSFEMVSFDEHPLAVPEHDLPAEHREKPENRRHPGPGRTVLGGRDGGLPQHARLRQFGLRHPPLPAERPNRLTEGAWTGGDGIHGLSFVIRNIVYNVSIRQTVNNFSLLHSDGAGWKGPPASDRNRPPLAGRTRTTDG